MASRSVASRIVIPLGISLLLFAAAVCELAVPGAWLFAAMCIEHVPSAARIVVAASLATVIVGFFWWRHPISGIAMACGLVAVVMLSRLPTIGESPVNWVAHLAQVAYYGGDLRKQAVELKRRGISPAVAAITRDGFGSMGSGVALDPTGQIALLPDKRSAAWQATGGQTELGVDGLQTWHIVGDYYAWFHY